MITYRKTHRHAKGYCEGRRSYAHRSLETEGTAHHAGTHEEAPALVRRQRDEGKVEARPFIVVFVERNGQGRIKRFRIG